MRAKRMNNKKEKNKIIKIIIIIVVLVLIPLMLLTIFIFNVSNKIKNTKKAQETINDYNSTEYKYQSAISEYEEGNFEEAKKIFQELGDYEDSNEYLNNTNLMISLQGTWEENYLQCYAQIEGWKITEYESKYGYIVNTGDYALGNGKTNLDKVEFYDLHNVYLELKNNQLEAYYYEDGEKKKYENEKFIYDKSNNRLYIKIANKDIEYKLTKKNYRIAKRKDPTIGMSKSEVENSTWGEPEDINRTITAYGTREQWCYSNYRYIYFEDGIVTSIQD